MPDFTINDRWLDVDFADEMQRLGIARGDNGCATFGDYPRYQDNVQVLSEAVIREAVERVAAADRSNCDLVRRVRDQSREGSCVGQAGTAGIEVVQTEQLGKDRSVLIGSQSLYKQIGRSPSSGATISDCLRALTQTGCLPLDTPENRERFNGHVMPDVGFNTRWPSGWQSTAALFRISEYFAIRSVQELKTALVSGHPVIVGREGHSILYLDLLYRNGRYVVKYVNSWSLRWGDGHGEFSGGFGYDSESQIRKSASWAFAIRGVKAPAETN